MADKKIRCKSNTADGTQCKRNAMPGEIWCAMHDPKRTKESPSEYTAPKNSEETKELILKTMSDVASGAIEPRRAQAVAELGRVAFKFFKDSPEEDPAKGLSEMSEDELRQMAANLISPPSNVVKLVP